ncbi:MAG: hypothetical protein ACI9R3_000757 [Verrucomicrobiales bacterium]|jgi:hypothetical protein
MVFGARIFWLSENFYFPNHLIQNSLKNSLPNYGKNGVFLKFSPDPRIWRDDNPTIIRPMRQALPKEK